MRAFGPLALCLFAALSAPSVALAEGTPAAAATRETMVPDEPATEMRSPALFGGGLAALGLGLAAVPLGFVAMVEGSSSTCVLECGPPRSDALAVLGGVAIGFGAGAILASIPMIVVGASRVPSRVQLAGGPPGSHGLSLSLAF